MPFFRFGLIIALTLDYTTTLFGVDEIQRIDSMVHDISLLRHKYENQIAVVKSENLLLEKELQKALKEIQSLKNQIKRVKKYKKKRTVVVKKVIVPVKICEDENKFPKLKLKKQ